MPNNRFNKQVTPKGYRRGGAVRSMKKDPIADYVRSVKEIRKPKGAKRLGKMGGGMMMERPMMKKGGPSKKPKIRKIGVIGVGKAKDYPGIKEIIKMNKQEKIWHENGWRIKTC
jgi:hypothetical protein